MILSPKGNIEQALALFVGIHREAVGKKHAKVVAVIHHHAVQYPCDAFQRHRGAAHQISYSTWKECNCLTGFETG